MARLESINALTIVLAFRHLLSNESNDSASAPVNLLRPIMQILQALPVALKHQTFCGNAAHPSRPFPRFRAQTTPRLPQDSQAVLRAMNPKTNPHNGAQANNATNSRNASSLSMSDRPYDSVIRKSR